MPVPARCPGAFAGALPQTGGLSSAPQSAVPGPGWLHGHSGVSPHPGPRLTLLIPTNHRQTSKEISVSTTTAGAERPGRCLPAARPPARRGAVGVVLTRQNRGGAPAPAAKGRGSAGSGAGRVKPEGRGTPPPAHGEARPPQSHPPPGHAAAGNSGPGAARAWPASLEESHRRGVAGLGERQCAPQLPQRAVWGPRSPPARAPAAAARPAADTAPGQPRSRPRLLPPAPPPRPRPQNGAGTRDGGEDLLASGPADSRGHRRGQPPATPAKPPPLPPCPPCCRLPPRSTPQAARPPRLRSHKETSGR